MMDDTIAAVQGYGVVHPSKADRCLSMNSPKSSLMNPPVSTQLGILPGVDSH